MRGQFCDKYVEEERQQGLGIGGFHRIKEGEGGVGMEGKMWNKGMGMG